MPASKQRRWLLPLVSYGVVVALTLPLVAYLLPRLNRPEVHFRHPLAFALGLALPLVAYLSFHAERWRSPTLAFSRVTALSGIQQGVLGYLVHLPRALRLVALGLLVIALARPQRLSIEQSDVEGIDIVIALDVSNSMQETDLDPDRLTAAKRVIDDFIRRRPTDRIALVIFGKEAFTQCPLTLDSRAVRNLLAEVRLGLIDGQGTAIGNALGTALNRLRKSTAKSRVIVLVTDGDDNASKLDPRQAARFAQTLGVRIFTILIGQDSLGANAPPVFDPFGNITARRQRYPVNPRLLEEIAQQTGGVPYLATDQAALQRRFQAILEDLDRSKLRSQIPHYSDLYSLVVLPALLLLGFEILLSLTRFRRFP